MPDLTRGPVLTGVVGIAAPLSLANLLQQGYLLVDSAVVGRYVGVTGLAAMGAAQPLYTILTSLFTGVSAAFSVRLGHLAGAGRRDDPSTLAALAVCTAGWSAVCAVAAVLATGPLLTLAGVTGEVAAQARTFMVTLGAGMVAVYALGAVCAVLTGRGDARAATGLMIVASVLNAAFAWLFVGPWRLGIAGAALAVLAANALAAALGLARLVREQRRRPPGPDRVTAATVRAEVRRGLRIGTPMAAQYLLVGVGVLVLVWIITPFGESALAALTVVARLELLTSVLFLTLSGALMVFTAQNTGAGHAVRVRVGVRHTAWLTVALTAAVTLLLLTGRGPIAALFSDSPATRLITERYILITAPFFLCYTLMVVLHGWFNGIARTVVPLACTVVSLGVVRLPLSYALGQAWGVDGVMWAAVVGWAVGLAYTLLATRRALTTPPAPPPPAAPAPAPAPARTKRDAPSMTPPHHPTRHTVRHDTPSDTGGQGRPMIRSLFVSDILPRRPANGAVRRMDVVTHALAELGPVDALFLAPPDAAPPPPEETAHFARTGTVTMPAYSGARAFLEIAARGPSAAHAAHQRRALTRAAALPAWSTDTRYTLVWFNRERAWLPLRGRFTGRTVVDVDDFEDVLIRRWARLGRGVWGVPLTPWQRTQARRSIAWWERVHQRLAREVDVAVVACADDMTRLNAAHTVVVPNTYPAPPSHPPHPPHPSGSTILFQGSFDWPPNADAAAWLTREILPLIHERVPDARVVLAGASTPEVAALAGPHVEVAGAVEDMTPHLRAADLVVVPLRVGSGTRIKILEAFAHGVPVVSTTIGAEGLDVVAGDHLAVADTAAALARHCADLLTDPSLGKALTTAATRLHTNRHLPEHAATRVRWAALRAAGA
ncbi:MATE family efflux transporter [Streptomyces sp. 4N509B]|uniref:MATE family efflux transporter n=1 Tax=Streptomyces sp. 4N509B TaxID=3457413 RepID=UPI003FD0A80C